VEATSAPRPHVLRIAKPRKLLGALSDERLVEHVRRGDEAAFEVLYERHSGGILGFCRHMLGSISDAEDAAQHTFIAAHADIQRHDRRDLHVKAWLYTIARNRCLSMLRARREQPSDDTVEVATASLVQDVERREDLRQLLADVTKLPDEQREALVLAEVGDLSHGDISEILGCEASKVKSLVFQARTALIDRRIARDTPCTEIREQLATLRGGALRRSHIRHHLEVCPGCSEYREEVRRQRAMLAIALPVVPSAALKANILGGIGIGGGSAAAGDSAAAAAAGGFSVAAPSGLAKLGVVAVLAAGGVGGATVANNGQLPLLEDSPPAQKISTQAGAVVRTTATDGVAATRLSQVAQQTKSGKTTDSRRSAKGSERGFTPITGESNGARAREFAKTRGKGRQTSAAARQRHLVKTAPARPAKPVRPQHVAVPKSNVPAAPTHTQPAPTTTQPTAPTRTAPTPTTQQPAPTTTQPAPTGGGGKGIINGAGKTLSTTG
jgi:RNA polymerase sigma factor (sigma-70 family)